MQALPSARVRPHRDFLDHSELSVLRSAPASSCRHAVGQNDRCECDAYFYSRPDTETDFPFVCVDCPFNANCTGNAVINKRDTW